MTPKSRLSDGTKRIEDRASVRAVFAPADPQEGIDRLVVRQPTVDGSKPEAQAKKRRSNPSLALQASTHTTWQIKIDGPIAFEPAWRKCCRYPFTARSARLRGFTLLEIILVLAIIGVAAALLLPSVSASFGVYYIERAAEDLHYRIAHTRLQAMELGVPYAFTFRPESDQFMTWACEPLTTNQGLGGMGGNSSAAASSVATGDAYDRHYFELNDRPDNKEFHFLAANLSEALTTMGLGYEARTGMALATGSDGVGSSSLLSQRKLGLATPSTRSTAALQIPGLQLGDVTQPIVFEPDGTADRDAIIRIADRSNRIIEITIHGLTGAISTSAALSVEEATASGANVSRVANDRPRGAPVSPSRSRETRQGSGGTP